MYAVRRDAISIDRKPRLGMVRLVTRRDPTGNYSSGQTDSDGRRRLHPSAVFYIASATHYLAILHIWRKIEKKLKDVKHGGIAVNLRQFLEKFLAAGEVGTVRSLALKQL